MSNWRINWIDYYELLGIDRQATKKEIKNAYINKMKEHHPDLYEGKDDQKEHEEISYYINQAKEVLLGDEKDEYDAAYDARLNGTHVDDMFDEDSDINYEDIKEQYTEEERVFAEKEAFKIVVEEELQKIDEIIKTKNDILYSVYVDEIDIYQYYNNIKELLSISSEYIDGLNKLAETAIDIDILLQQKIYDSIDYLNENLAEIPTSIDEIKLAIKKAKNKKVFESKYEKTIEKGNELLEKINSLFYYSYKGLLNNIEYISVSTNTKLEVKNCIDELEELSKISKLLDTDCNTKPILDLIAKLNLEMNNIPNNYLNAVKKGKIKKIIEDATEIINDFLNITKNFLSIKDDISKSNDINECNLLYKQGIKLISNFENKIDSCLENIKSVEDYLRENSDIEDKLFEEYYNKALDMYQSSKNIYDDSKQYFTFFEKSAKKYEEYLNEKEIIENAKSFSDDLSNISSENFNNTAKREILNELYESLKIVFSLEKREEILDLLIDYKKIEEVVVDISVNKERNDIESIYNDLMKIKNELNKFKDVLKIEIEAAYINCDNSLDNLYEQQEILKEKIGTRLILTIILGICSAASFYDILFSQHKTSWITILIAILSSLGTFLCGNNLLECINDESMIENQIEKEKKLQKKVI